MIEYGACQDGRLGLTMHFRPQPHKWRVRMAKVMIKCPDTGKLVFTGVFGDKTLLESMQIKKNKMARCSACGKEHLWEKQQAVLQD
jgi:ribosomal protein L32